MACEMVQNFIVQNDIIRTYIPDIVLSVRQTLRKGKSRRRRISPSARSFSVQSVVMKVLLPARHLLNPLRGLSQIRDVVTVMQMKRRPAVLPSTLIESYAVPLTALTANDATDSRA